MQRLQQDFRYHKQYAPVLFKKACRGLGKVFPVPAGQVPVEEMRGDLRHRPFHGVHLEAQDTRRAPEDARFGDDKRRRRGRRDVLPCQLQG